MILKRGKFLILLLVSSSLFASSLDILDMHGSVWGEFYRASNSPNSNLQFIIDQGIRFEGVPWVEGYFKFSKDQQLEITNTEWVAGGIRNNTWMPPFTFGIEYRNFLEPVEEANTTFLVGYVAISRDWNLKGRYKE